MFNVSWAGDDLGARITGYDVYVRTNSDPWALWLANTPQTSERFLGQTNAAYCFYSQAQDGTGQVQPTNSIVTACTTTPANSPPWFEQLSTNNCAIKVNETLVVTCTAADLDEPATNLTFSLVQAPDRASIDPKTGESRWTPRCDQGSTTTQVILRVTDSANASGETNLTVMVLECVEASLGNTAVHAGGSNSVSVQLLSTVELTNLAFVVEYQPERFTNFTMDVDTQYVSHPLLT